MFIDYGIESLDASRSRVWYTVRLCHEIVKSGNGAILSAVCGLRGAEVPNIYVEAREIDSRFEIHNNIMYGVA